MGQTGNTYGGLKLALNAGTKDFGEVKLFRRMLEYFNGNPACTMLETHQSYVMYDNNRRCEISDLMIVSYSAKYKCMKLTFLQAKCAKRKGYGLQDNGFKFILDNKQYHLLKNRPIIDPRSSGLAPTILRDACSSAISSYGVFYWERKDKINFGFEVTDLLQPVNDDETTISKTCYFADIRDLHGCYPWWIDYMRYCGLKCVHCQVPQGCEKKPCCSNDLLSTIDVNCFESAIANFEIGSPICAECAKACQPMRTMARSVFSSVEAVGGHKKNIGAKMSAFNQFKTAFGLSGDDDSNGGKEIENAPFAVKNILLINADEYMYHDYYKE